MPDPTSRPVPQPDIYVPTQPFWQGAREGRLMLQYCRDTGRFQHHPRPVSIHNGRRNIEWREVSGNGFIYAFTVLRVPGPGISGRLPLNIALVELDEKVRILGNIVGEEATPRIGQRVALAWDHLDGGIPYPAFRIVMRQR